MIAQQRELTVDDYALWHEINLESFSPDGKWLSYSKSYQDKHDTLFVKSTAGTRQYALPNASQGQLLQPANFGYCIRDSLYLMDMESGSVNLIASGKDHFYIGNKHLLVAIPETKSTYSLDIYDSAGKIVRSINNVAFYTLSPERDRIVYTTFISGKYSTFTEQTIYGSGKKKIIADVPFQIKAFTWSQKATHITFLGEGNRIFVYNVSTGKLLQKQLTGIEIAMEADGNPLLKVSEDGSRVLFYAVEKNEDYDTAKDDDLQVWNTADSDLYNHRKKAKTITQQRLLKVWWPQKDKIIAVTSTQYSWVMLCGETRYAIIADPWHYEPQFKRFADKDYYLLDMETGAMKLLLEKHNGTSSALWISPDGKMISYFRDGHWWSYNIVTAIHKNLTDSTTGVWENAGLYEEPGAWGFAGWSSDNSYVLLYDFNDVWAFSADGKIRRRLTKGLESGLQFRLLPDSALKPSRPNYAGLAAAIFDTNSDMLLSGYSTKDGSNSYYRLSFAKGEQPLITGQGYLSGLKWSSDRQSFAYTSQTYSQSPSVWFRSLAMPESHIQALSNKQQQKFFWGNAEMVSFTNGRGTGLKAALFYPAGYDSTKKYPMIVSIYSNLSQQCQKYVNPSKWNPVGFNISNLTTMGYFVLLPDIVYQYGDPGLSALDCVSAAVESAIHTAGIDPARIGLIGHSFGGYESNFIMTRSDRFAAGISGCGVSDMVSHYLSINKSNSMPESWRYEFQQYRMGRSFYDDTQAYLRNSPIHNAAEIKAPLLIWAGENDSNVNSLQSMELYLALRRLQKKGIMLVYSKEGHILYDRENMWDLTCKIQQWFGYYLKDEREKEWMLATKK